MTQNTRRMWNDRELPTDGANSRQRGLSASYGLFGFLVFVALACGGCSTELPPLPNPPGAHTAVRLSPGDTIKLSFAEETDLDQTQKIRRDGKVSLPLIGEVTAAGKRVTDFQREIVRRFQDHLENPEVLVTLENGVASVTVAGFANKPGPIAFDRPMTVYQVIMQAGGVSDYGSMRNIHLTRVINGEQLTESFSVKPSVRGEPVKPEYVQDGDVIYIGRSLF